MRSISNLYARAINFFGSAALMQINRRPGAGAHAARNSQEDKVLDTILLAAGIGALFLTVLYAYACERM